MSTRHLTKAEINHLTRLPGFIECQIGLEPERLPAVFNSIVQVADEENIEQVRELAKTDLEKANNIPIYIRQGVKALRKVVNDYNQGNTDKSSCVEIEVKRIE